MTLLNDAIVYEPSLTEFVSACQKATQYYVEERYPFVVASELVEKEVKESLEEAKRLIKNVLILIGKR